MFNSLSTTYPLLIDVLSTAFLLYAIIAPVAVALYVKLLFSKDFPGKRHINELKIEVSEFSGMVADLSDRFARFQNKEGMRIARETKQRERTVLEEAQEIAAQAAPPEATGKRALYAKMRRMNS